MMLNLINGYPIFGEGGQHPLNQVFEFFRNMSLFIKLFCLRMHSPEPVFLPFEIKRSVSAIPSISINEWRNAYNHLEKEDS